MNEMSAPASEMMCQCSNV